MIITINSHIGFLITRCFACGCLCSTEGYEPSGGYVQIYGAVLGAMTYGFSEPTERHYHKAS